MKRECIEAIREFSKSMDRFAIVTITESFGSSPASVGQNIIIKEDGNFVGTSGGGLIEKHIRELAIECIKKSISRSFEFDLKEVGMSCGGKVKGFIQFTPADENIIIVGGGHIAKKLYDIGKNLSFQITIVDDRVEVANSEIYSECEVVCCEYDELLKNVVIHENTYIVIVTRGHESDLKTLKEVVTKNPKYIGMIGSKKKVYEIKKQILSEDTNKATEVLEGFKNLYAPIGINIAKNDPAEIAISIIAEILTIKNKGVLEHMRDRL